MCSNLHYKLLLEYFKKFFGNRCNNPLCQNTNNLEFAHLKPTNLSGAGRGRNKRVIDIKNNINSYILLCKTCHSKYDNGLHS